MNVRRFQDAIKKATTKIPYQYEEDIIPPSEKLRTEIISELDEIVRFGLLGDTGWLEDNFSIKIWDKEFGTIKGYQDIDTWIKYVFKDKEEAELFSIANQYNL